MPANLKSFWSNSIKKIIITPPEIEKYEKSVLNQTTEWNITPPIINKNEDTGHSIVVFNGNLKDPKRIIFFSSRIFDYHNFIDIVLQHLLHPYAENIILNKFRNTTCNGIKQNNFRNHIYDSLYLWTLEKYLILLQKEFEIGNTPDSNSSLVLHAFIRGLKSNLFEYNSDEKNEDFRLSRFWNSYFLY